VTRSTLVDQDPSRPVRRAWPRGNRLEEDPLKGVEPQQKEESLEKDELSTKKK
jgi:hypothetical protein